MTQFIATFIKPYAKAITSAIVGGIVLLVSKEGFTLDDTTTIALTVIIGGLVNGLFTYLVPNTPAP